MGCVPCARLWQEAMAGRERFDAFESQTVTAYLQGQQGSGVVAYSALLTKRKESMLKLPEHGRGFFCQQTYGI